MKKVVLKITDFIEATKNITEPEAWLVVKNGKFKIQPDDEWRNVFDIIGCNKNVECECFIPAEHYKGILSAVLEGYKEQAEYVLLFISENNEIEELYTLDFLSLVLFKKSEVVE